MYLSCIRPYLLSGLFAANENVLSAPAIIK
jgi:hypothetical protein